VQGGDARFITNAGSTFDISGLSSTGMTVGSIEGAGNYELGSKALTVGLNNLSTEVSGPVTDGGGSGGSLIKVRATWEHEYKYSDLPITAGFAGIPGPSDTFYGPSEGHDSAILSAGVSVQWTPMIATYLNYDGQLGRSRYDSNAVTGGVRMSF
jgi:hypothetical protein